MKEKYPPIEGHEHFLEDILENADFGMMIATDTNVVLYENSKFSAALNISGIRFLRDYPAKTTAFPLVINGKAVSMFQLFYKTLPCFCFFVFSTRGVFVEEMQSVASLFY